MTVASCAKARNVDEAQDIPVDDDAVVLPDDPTGDLIEDESTVDDPGGGGLADDAGSEEAGAEEFDPFIGATITVTGTVDEVVDRNAFEIAVRGRGAGAAGFLVLLPDDDVEVGDVVEVTGTVREPDFDELRAELNFEIDADLYSQSDRQQVIVAERVEVVGQGTG